MSKVTRIEAPIKGVFGEVQVGDTVMVVTTGYSHRASVSKGKYLGYIESKGYYKQRAQIAIEYDSNVYIKPDGTEFDWRKDYNYNTWKEVQPTLTNKKIKLTRIATLKLNRIATLKD